MENMKVTLLKDTGDQRYYKLSHKLQTAAYCFGRKKVSIQEEIDKHERLKPEYEHLKPNNGVDIICISDAHTHIERIVFAAMVDDNGNPGRLRTQLDGYNTLMIHGGNSEAVYPDYVYLRRLASVNGLQFHYSDFCQS